MSNVWIFSLWLVVSTAWAAEPPVDLDRALRKYQNVKHLHVQFEQTKKLKDLDFEIHSRGELDLAPNRMTWRIHSPSPLSVEWKDGEARIGDKASVPEKYRSEMGQLLSWLRFDASALARDYAIQRPSPTSFTFSPKKAGGIFKSMQLTLNARGFAETVELTEVSDDRMILKFTHPRITYQE